MYVFHGQKYRKTLSVQLSAVSTHEVIVANSGHSE